MPYPDGCAAYGLSARRCAYIVEWAKREAGSDPDAPPTVELLGDSECPDEPLPCTVGRTMAFVVRIRLTAADGTASDHPLFCGVGGDVSLLCAEEPRIRTSSPTMAGYTDVPCSGDPAPEGACATPLPSLEPAAVAASVPLAVAALDIPIDHVGAYSIPIGEAVLPNGVLSTASFGIVDDTPPDLLLSDGLFLAVTSLDGGPAFENYYTRGWHAGTERVEVSLTFTVEWFEPGAVIEVRDIHVK